MHIKMQGYFRGLINILGNFYSLDFGNDFIIQQIIYILNLT